MRRIEESRSSVRPIVAIAGPTGSGKSSLALSLAEKLNGEIVNYDSVQVYRGLDIGSAKTPPLERNGVTHHLLDIVDVWQEFSAGEYARRASEAIGEIWARQRIPILVGGTGLYLRALLDGLSPAPGRDEEFRVRLSQSWKRNPRILSRYLRRFDPAAAARIHPNDRQKLIRAVELAHIFGNPATEIQSKARSALAGAQTFKLGLNPNRAELYERIDKRAVQMFSAGLLEETEAFLRNEASSGSLRALQSLGYKQALQVISGEISLQRAIEETQKRTRQYAKRQLTWFRSDPEIYWFNEFGDGSAIQITILHWLTQKLNEMAFQNFLK